MTAPLVTVEIPQPLYRRLERVAIRLQKPLAEVLAETLQATLPPSDEVSPEIQAEMAALANLDEKKLHEIAQSEMSPADQQTFDHLLDLQSIQPLTADETTQLEALRTEYGRILLRKARAFALLAERGQPLPLE